ncbi:hypothetical protein BFW01_g944 [Lasiodiplodia theobromae]|uniref:Uncharacterized protein n=1 Tax=Lasiodiplodia theobromae TaxID=45133 RepID=A0A8H7MBL9_9PEZI|nr:hypothetical protein BFW01_g944 [Lasiodiplodia theobromae]
MSGRGDAVSKAEKYEALGEGGAGGGGAGARQAGEEADKYNEVLSTAPLGGEDEGKEERAGERETGGGAVAGYPAAKLSCRSYISAHCSLYIMSHQLAESTIVTRSKK